MTKKKTILLVDDSENDLYIMHKAFEAAKLTNPTQELYNGENAIAYLSGDTPYNDRNRYPLPIIMVMDLNMPGKNGFDVLEWIKHQPLLKRLPVIIMTSSIRSEDVGKAFDLGANAFLVKPSTLEELISMARCLDGWIQYNHFPDFSGS